MPWFNMAWQNEAWNFYRSNGTLQFGVNWRAQAVSRVRLLAAVVQRDGEEPEPLPPEHPASVLISEYFNGTPGQSLFLQNSVKQLDVAGEWYVVIYDDPFDEDGGRSYHVKSKSELRVGSGRVNVGVGRSKTVDVWECLIEAGMWKQLPPETLVFRIWNPDPQYSYMATSTVNAAARYLRLIDLMERRIMAQAVSRLASNGVLLYPQEQTFIPKPDFDPKSGLDPFTHEWLNIAGKTIDNPGSALAALPLPVKVPKDLIQYWQHMDFANPYDEHVMEVLQYLYDRLATSVNIPKEMVTGLGDTSHWNAWALDESAVKIHIDPDVELICHGVTRGYLQPGLKAMGLSTLTPNGEIVCWYDSSELVKPADMSAAAEEAYRADEISGDAYRRLKGMDPSDKPDKTALREQLLLKMAKDPTNGPAAIEELTGAPVAGASTGPGGEEAGTPAPEPTPAAGPPDQPSEQRRVDNRGAPG
jgi:hypothetical protein